MYILNHVTNFTSRGPTATPIMSNQYLWNMKHNPEQILPSLSLQTSAVSEESVYHLVDEVVKSHLYSLYTGLQHDPQNEVEFVVWIDFDYFSIKTHPKMEKRVLERYELDALGKEKTRKYSYFYLEGLSLALSPGLQSLKFNDDPGLEYFGLRLEEIKPNFNQGKPTRALYFSRKMTKWSAERFCKYLETRGQVAN